MAKLLSWIMKWLPGRASSAPAPLASDDDEAAFGVEAAFTMTSRPMALDERSSARQMDADWAIRRINSRSAP